MNFEKILPNLYVLYGNISANTYLLLENEKILIDPGVHEKEYLLDALKKLQVKEEDIKTILVTHAHVDHFVNCRLFPKAKVYCSEKAIKLFKAKDLVSTVSLWLHNTYFPENLHLLKDKQIIGNDNFKLETLELPGHTSNDIAFYDKENKLLFSGDVLFQGAFGRVDLFDSSKDAMEKSLKKLEKLDFDLLLPGHGKVYKATKENQKENIKDQIKYLERI
jgi:glyoxylase-like metal-dependent hydrolase (beta-lactamase superfamily II)